MMSFHLSNNLLGIINLTFLFSIPILVAGIWLGKNGVKERGLTADSALISIGVIIIMVSLEGFIGSCCRMAGLLWAYSVVILILILFGLSLTVVTFVVSNKGLGKALSGKGYKEYMLGNYSNLIRKIVNETKNLNQIKTCMVDTKSGCCKPSNDCGFTYRSPTNWTDEKEVYSNPDCKAWDKDPKVLCFNCQSCKAGVADIAKHTLKKEAIINVVFLIFLIIIYCIACCAFRNNLRGNAYDNQKWRP